MDLNITIILLYFIAFTVALVLHEFAHAYMADRLGDPTPRLSGRLSINPLRHYDPVGTTLLLFLLITRSPFIFGWAKPVPFDPYNLENPKRDSALIALAGPATNIALALIFSFLLRTILMEIPVLNQFSVIFILSNIILAVFNLIPIYPLDGSKILYGLLPLSTAVEYESIMQRYGMYILLLMIIPFGGQSVVSQLILPVINFIGNLLLPVGSFF